MEKIKLKQIKYKVSVGYSGYTFIFSDAEEAMNFFDSAVNNVEDKEKITHIELEAVLVESEYEAPVICTEACND